MSGCPFERSLGPVAGDAGGLLVGVVVTSWAGDGERDAVVDLGGSADAAGALDLAAVTVSLEDAAVVGLALPAGLAEPGTVACTPRQNAHS